VNSTAARFASRWEIPEEGALQVRDELLIGLGQEWRKELSLSGFASAVWSPISLGLLLLRSTGVDMTPLPEEVQSFIRSISPQHRIELRGSNESLSRGVACFDGRCMYLGCCDDLGSGGGHYRFQKGFDGNDRGKARVQFTVPSDWRCAGILPVKSEDGASWRYPESGQHETWADLQEVRQAIRAGWQVVTLEALVWGKGDPLGLWARRLQEIYRSAHLCNWPKYEGVASCIRTLALHTIGAMHTPWRKETVEVLPDSPSVTLDSIQGMIDGGVKVERWVDKGHLPDEYHPEWTTAIWARARCRVLRALLRLPAELILGVRGDAVYLDGRALDMVAALPEFQSAGECGKLRLKWYDPNPRPRVRSWSGLEPPGG